MTYDVAWDAGDMGCGELVVKLKLLLRKDVPAGFPAERLSVHVCRGNWTADESAALSGDYRPLIPLLSSLNVQNLLLELRTPRAGRSTRRSPTSIRSTRSSPAWTRPSTPSATTASC